MIANEFNEFGSISFKMHFWPVCPPPDHQLGRWDQGKRKIHNGRESSYKPTVEAPPAPLAALP